MNSKGKLPLFNSEYLSKEAKKEQNKVYICEGVFDAMSIEQEGQKAISLNSTEGKEKLIEYIKEHFETAKSYLYILCLDNDEAGQKGTKYIQDELNKMDIKNAVLEIPKEYKDVNEYYKDIEHTAFKEAIEKNYFNDFDKQYIDYYIGTDFLEDIKKASRYKAKKTGFKYLDEQLGGGIRTGLYVLGAIPSLGKTTLVLQMADNLAKQGEKVLIFSLEQSKFELVAKAISRITHINSPRKR